MDQSWSEARTPEGRIYYYNAVTRATQWTKPEALMALGERALANQPWKEYTTDQGRKYWYNTETKTSSWEMPEVYRTALSQSSSIPSKPPAPAPTFVAGGAPNFAQHVQQRDRDDFGQSDRGGRGDRGDRGDREDRGGSDRPAHYSQSDNLRSNFVSATTNEPDYATFEEAEAAFIKLLRRSNVQPDWTWEETMREVIKDPQYRALKDPKDRKAAFEKYAAEARIQDRERAKERIAKLRQDFGTMLKSHPEIKHYTRWKTARPIIEGETIFRSTSDDTERRQLFEEYILGLKKAHAEYEVSTRKAALEDLVTLLKSLDLEPYTRWSDAHGMIDSSEQFQSDDKFKTLTKSDILTAFENHIKALERTFNDARQLEKTQKGTRERQHRDQFISLLRDLKSGGKIKAGTKWMDVHPLIEDDPRYVTMLGQSGSTPLDLFWDMVEEDERSLRGKRNEVLDVLDDKRYEITSKTTLDEFMSLMHTDRRTSNMSTDDLDLIFSRLHEKVLRRNEEDKHHAERAQRRAIDALRSRIKHLEPPVRATDSWEHDVRPRVEKYEEYRALDSDELRRSAFEKVMRRLKDKEVDVEQTERTRRIERADRSERDPRSNGHRHERAGRSRYSRTPEPDAYEADRKKAIADRERQYRKAAPGLSPPPTDSAGPPRRREGRDRYDERDRYDDRDRYERVGRSGGPPPYERERREREPERERPYINRADPREAGAKELDYGESGRAGSMSGSGSVGTSRRRRASEESDGAGGKRDVKRLKRERRSKTPIPAEPASVKEEEEALKSGSEEGEIEEV